MGQSWFGAGLHAPLECTLETAEQVGREGEQEKGEGGARVGVLIQVRSAWPPLTSS